MDRATTEKQPLGQLMDWGIGSCLPAGGTSIAVSDPLDPCLAAMLLEVVGE